MKLFVSDLDGTLLNNEFRISANNVRAIRHMLKTKNIQMVVATGRIYKDAYAICQAYEINPFIISNNGACVFSDQKESCGGNGFPQARWSRSAAIWTKLKPAIAWGPAANWL